MYCEFYGFREKPFTITPNPRFIFLSKNHREAFAHLLYGIDNHGGFIELTGEVGTGKTTVLRTLFEQLDERGHRTALIFNPCLSALELMRSINREFGIAWEELTISELLDALNQFLISENTAGRTVVLVIDEAQNLEPHVLEQVRLISNLETKTDKLIQIVLAGQPELGRLLNSSALRQVSQRITVSYHLTPMDFEDTKAYIGHRLEIAGDWRAASFTPQALKKIFRYSGGVPRLINILCDRALLFGYVEESREISARMVTAAIAEIRREQRRGRLLSSREMVLVISAILAVIGVLASHYWAPRGFSFSPPFQHSVPGTTTPFSAPHPLLLDRELSGLDESKSAVTAFNALAALWHVPPVSGQPPRQNPRGLLERAAAQRGLTLLKYNGSLGLLARMGYPSILEFTLPGVDGKRYLALTGLEQGRFYITPPLAGRNSLSSAELDTYWSGGAYLPWKNFLNIPSSLSPGTRGPEVTALQQLLRDARLFKGGKNGVFDRESVAAVKAFQTACGIMPDGRAGSLTLLLLYRAGRKFPVPALEKQEEHQKK
jgi:general secretion pathway protein A